MDKLRIAQHANALRAKQEELVALLRNRDGIEAAAEPDLFDEIQTAAERALVVQGLDRNSVLLREVQAALSRIADGSYGECLNCESEISSKRLYAAPWASLCLECQEREEELKSNAPDYGMAA